MTIIVVATALVLLIAFYQATCGMYGSLIMAILTVFCAAVAFNYYEPLSRIFYDRQPMYAEAISLLALFVLPLLILRWIADRLLSGNVVMNVWGDRIGGGILGLFTGVVAVGMLGIMVQMLPFGPRFLTFSPFTDSLQRDQAMGPLRPDEFTVGMAKILSAGSLSGQQPYASVHDNLLLELFCNRNRVEQTRSAGGAETKEYAGRTDAKPDSVTVSGMFEPSSEGSSAEPWTKDPNQVPANPLLEGDDSRIVIVRTEIDESAADEDHAWRLPATHFRLVVADKDGAISSHYPVAYLTWTEHVREASGSLRQGRMYWKAYTVAGALSADNGRGAIAEVARIFVQREQAGVKAKKLVVDWVYRLPPEAAPQYLVFRRIAMQPLPELVSGMPSPEKALGRIVAAK